MTCKQLKDDGEPCGASPMTGSDYCFYHNPAVSVEMKHAAHVKGGQANRARVKEPLPPITANKSGDVVQLLEDTVNRVRMGSLDLRVANSIGFLSGHLLKALELSELEERFDALEQKILKLRQ